MVKKKKKKQSKRSVEDLTELSAELSGMEKAERKTKRKKAWRVKVGKQSWRRIFTEWNTCPKPDSTHRLLSVCSRLLFDCPITGNPIGLKVYFPPTHLPKRGSVPILKPLKPYLRTDCSAETIIKNR